MERHRRGSDLGGAAADATAAAAPTVEVGGLADGSATSSEDRATPLGRNRPTCAVPYATMSCFRWTTRTASAVEAPWNLRGEHASSDQWERDPAARDHPHPLTSSLAVRSQTPRERWARCLSRRRLQRSRGPGGTTARPPSWSRTRRTRRVRARRPAAARMGGARHRENARREEQNSPPLMMSTGERPPPRAAGARPRRRPRQ